jgi:hypothetical protein
MSSSGEYLAEKKAEIYNISSLGGNQIASTTTNGDGSKPSRPKAFGRPTFSQQTFVEL